MKRVGVVLLFLILMITSLGISQEVKRLSLNDCIQIALKNNTSIVAARSDAKIATAGLKWAVEEMERRFVIFKNERVRDIKSYIFLG